MFRDAVVILDIDGTIAYDKDVEVLGPEKAALEALKTVAKKVILVSNGEHMRTQAFGESHGIFSHVSEFKKPNRKILQKILAEKEEGDKLVVIGDKFLTDGLLALQTKVHFVHVKSLQRKDESLMNNFIFFLDDVLGKGFDLLRLMRPQQWLKNLLVFAPAFFAGSIFVGSVLAYAFLAFIVFCLSASLVYIINDICDIESDRKHHHKKWRPLPSSNITTLEAALLAVVLAAILSLILYSLPVLLPIMLLYVACNVLYTTVLKHIPVFDVVLVASMYVMRVVAGSMATSLVASSWILACTFFASLFLISCKRYVEFKNPVRRVLDKYSKESLLGLLIISAALSVISYVIYTILGTPLKNAIYTTPFVVGVFLIILNDILRGDKDLETPELYLVKNVSVRLVILGWIVCMYVLVYTV
jgi:4-hydroxybenzoate polyprenyltransferase/predicted HAD superfamily phosphohydrolase YqeG